MKNSEMKELFLQADRQIRIKEAKKQKVLLLMAEACGQIISLHICGSCLFDSRCIILITAD